jgi:hypothetical protein
MCTEFILILIYFLVLSLINFLLFQLLKFYWKKINFLKKYEKILNQTKNKNIEILSFCYFFSKEKEKTENLLSNLNTNRFVIQDLFLLGNFYSILSKKKIGIENLYFFELMKVQSLPWFFSTEINE